MGEWNVRVVTTRQGFEALAVNMPSAWAKLDGIFKVPYSRRVIEAQIAKAGGVLNSAQKFYRSEDEVKAYRRSLLNGHNEGTDYVPPKEPDEVTRKCVLIPLALVKDFIYVWDNDEPPPDGDGGGNVPDSPPDGDGGGNVPDSGLSPTTPGGLSETTSKDDYVTSYSAVDGNLPQKVNSEKADETRLSVDKSQSSYLFEEDTSNLEEEKEGGVKILSTDECGEKSAIKDH